MLFEQPLIDNYVKPVVAVVQKVEQKPEEKKEPKKYTVVANDTLENIAKSHNTTVQRLFNANPDIADPNKIELSQVLIVPEESDVLQERPMPVTVEMSAEETDVARRNSSTPSRAVSRSRSSSAGNTYTPGYCTWYVKNMRPDIPNGLGNADTWYYRYTGSKGSTPAVGAVAVAKSYMHVAIVIGVNGGSVTVREMNYKGLYVVSERTTSASEFLYLY